MTLKEIFMGGSGALVVILTLVQFSPIKIDPWNAVGRVFGRLLKWIGRSLNGDVLSKLDELEGRKAEKEEVRLMLQRVEQKLTEVNAHYSADNITRRDNWMKQVNQYGDSIIAINKALAEVTAELKGNTRLTEEMFVQSSRDRIIDFAMKVADESAVVSREEFNRIFKVYSRYEKYIEERGLTNGEVDVSIQIIREAYEKHMKNHTFIEDVRGY